MSKDLFSPLSSFPRDSDLKVTYSNSVEKNFLGYPEDIITITIKGPATQTQEIKLYTIHEIKELFKVLYHLILILGGME
jgi:hypothetical protein